MKRTTHYSIILISLLISIWGCSVGENTAGGNATEAGNPALASVTGVLVDSNGIPMPLIPVSLSLVDTGVVLLVKVGSTSSVVFTDTTDEQGVYSIDNVPEGVYDLFATPPGEEPRVIVTLSAIIDSVITLEPIDIFTEVIGSSSSEVMESSSQHASSDLFESSTPLSSSSMSTSSSEALEEQGDLELLFESDLYDSAEVTIELSGLDTIYTFQYTKETDVFFIQISPGIYDLTIDIPGVRLIERIIQIDPKLELEFEVRLEELADPGDGYLYIEYISYHKDEQDILVTFEGISTQFSHHYTPDDRDHEEDLPQGEYQVTITPELGASTTRTLYIEGGLQVDWEILID